MRSASADPAARAGLRRSAPALRANPASRAVRTMTLWRSWIAGTGEAIRQPAREAFFAHRQTRLREQFEKAALAKEIEIIGVHMFRVAKPLARRSRAGPAVLDSRDTSLIECRGCRQPVRERARQTRARAPSTRTPRWAAPANQRDQVGFSAAKARSQVATTVASLTFPMRVCRRSLAATVCGAIPGVANTRRVAATMHTSGVTPLSLLLERLRNNPVSAEVLVSATRAAAKK